MKSNMILFIFLLASLVFFGSACTSATNAQAKPIDSASTPSVIPTYETDGSYNGQIYDSFLDLPLYDMHFAGEFEQGNKDEYDYYLNKYYQLLNNEVTFIDKETGDVYYLNQYEHLKIYPDEKLDLRDYTYCFFDMDGDDTPELCINGMYIFKYTSELDKYILWKNINGAYYYIRGSGKVTWENHGTSSRYAFFQLDENGEEIYSVFFMCAEQAETAHVVALPVYANVGKKIEIAEEIANQAYCFWADSGKMYGFRVTEEQYDELTRDYFIAQELAEENIKSVTFTYDELFGYIQ